MEFNLDATVRAGGTPEDYARSSRATWISNAYVIELSLRPISLRRPVSSDWTHLQLAAEQAVNQGLLRRLAIPALVDAPSWWSRTRRIAAVCGIAAFDCVGLRWGWTFKRPSGHAGLVALTLAAASGWLELVSAGRRFPSRSTSSSRTDLARDVARVAVRHAAGSGIRLSSRSDMVPVRYEHCHNRYQFPLTMTERRIPNPLRQEEARRLAH